MALILLITEHRRFHREVGCLESIDCTFFETSNAKLCKTKKTMKARKRKKGSSKHGSGVSSGLVWREQRSFSDSSFWHKKQNQSPLQIIAFSIATGGTELFLRGTQHFLQHRQDRPSKTLNHSVLLLVKRNDHFKHSLVFLVVFSERQELDEHGKDIVERDVVGVSFDHASHATG
jgi:hypothetical protein